MEDSLDDADLYITLDNGVEIFADKYFNTQADLNSLLVTRFSQLSFQYKVITLNFPDKVEYISIKGEEHIEQ